ncbi:SPOR domain-containing protein [Sphingomonas sp. CA1-15]|uniref:SPOR domain-containing protein n=2 Tax=Sphingomonas immobilis TaxID=3063997 RepID=A0ABT8ZUI8_9SPHN|nr:SPOR domain-containing protein [Sphingomonas sp. CA1-15]
MSVTALLLGGAVVSGAFAGDRDQSQGDRNASVEAAIARSMLTDGNTNGAVQHAESAVAAAPKLAAYRMTLGQAYLKAGRFASARDAFNDTLALDGNNAKAALNLSLALIATGDWHGARKVLDGHADIIPIADRGLAIALAGDPSAAVDLLIPAVRSPDATSKTRQNLALSLALAGRWADAKTIIAVDLSPADVDQRIQEWALFAKPNGASDQVAKLLGVKPVADNGQPVALALNAAAPVAVAEAAPAPVVAATEAPAAAAPAPVAVAAVAPSLNTGIQFGPRQEVVQPLPAKAQKAQKVALIKAAAASYKTAAPAQPQQQPAKGNFFVQVGAYDNAGVARDAWGRASRRFAGFSAYKPQGMSFATKSGNFYRLSVGGFTRPEAVKLCLSYRATGGKCFVRAGAGDQLASWVKPGRPQLASR